MKLNAPSSTSVDNGTSGHIQPVGPLLTGNCTLHHLGVVVKSIAAVAEEFARSISARWNQEMIYDPIQRVRVAFLEPMDLRNPVYELVEPAEADSPVSSFLSKRVGLHHICYEISSLEVGLETARAVGLFIVSTPKPAAAFNGRRIAWVSSKSRLLMEFLERGK